MNFIDAGYYNNGKYVEDLTYFSFDKLSEKEKGVILSAEYGLKTTPPNEKEILENEHGDNNQSAA